MFFFSLESVWKEIEMSRYFIIEGGLGGKTVPHVQIKLAEVLSREHLQQIQDMLWVVCWDRASGFGRIDDVLVVEFAARQPRAALSWDVVCLRLDDVEEKQCPAIKVVVVVVVLGGCGRCRSCG